MFSFLSKKLMLTMAFLLMASSAFSQPIDPSDKSNPFYDAKSDPKDPNYDPKLDPRNPEYFTQYFTPVTEIVDPLKDMNIEVTVKEQLAEFETLIRERVKNEGNLKFVEARLPKILQDYELYLTKYYTTVKAVDPMVSIDDLPEVDRILKEKFGWSTYDLMVEHERIVNVLQDEILPYMEAEIYEEKWELNKTVEDKDVTAGSNGVKKSTKNDYKYESNYERVYTDEYIDNYLKTAEEEILSYKAKWEEHIRSAIKAIEGYSKNTRSYTYSTGTTLVEEIGPNGEKIVTPVETYKPIKTGTLSDYAAEASKYGSSVESGLAATGAYTVNTIKNGFLFDDLNSIYLLERELAIGSQEIEGLDAKDINIKLFSALFETYKTNRTRFNEIMEKVYRLTANQAEAWLESNFEVLQAQTDAALALQNQKSEVNKVTWKTFGRELIGSSINILLAATIKDAIFTALDQSSFTSWLVPGEKKTDSKNENKWSSFTNRQISTYLSMETWAGLLTFLGTTQGVNYGGQFLIKGWEKNWQNYKAHKLTKVKNARFSFVNENAKKFASSIDRMPLTQRFKATKISTKLNKMLQSNMYVRIKGASNATLKETFRLVKGFGFFSLGFALGDRFSRFVTTKMMFNTELSLPDSDPVKIKAQELIDEMTSSGGSWAETANVAISLFLAEVLMTKAATIPKYYSIMKELNKKNCAVTYKALKEIFEQRRLIEQAKNMTRSPKSKFFRNWGSGLQRMTILFGLQTYIDEIIVSKLLFRDTIKDYEEKIEKISLDLQNLEVFSLIKQMVISSDINDVETRVYNEFDDYLFLEGVIASFKTRHDDVNCCLGLGEGTEELESKGETGMSPEMMRLRCLYTLLANIYEPEKNEFVCSTANIKAKAIMDNVLDGATPEQQEIIKKGEKKIIELVEKEEAQDTLLGLIEKGKFSDAKALLTAGDYDATAVALLITAIDGVSASYNNMTVKTGLEMLNKLFTETYPNVIGTETINGLRLKREVLNALTTAVYKKLVKVGATYYQDGLVGEDYIQSQIYALLKIVVMLPETFPGHKSSIYQTAANLGFNGVTTSQGGVTTITVPDELEQEDDVKPENDTNKAPLVVPDNAGSGSIIPDSSKTPEYK